MLNEIKFKAVKKVTIEQSLESESGDLNLEGIIIAGKKYKLRIENHSLKKGEEKLVLDFNDGDYQIIIEKNGIRFARTLYRPEHDHNDIEYFQKAIDNKTAGFKKGEAKWLSRMPYHGEGRDYFRIPFGAESEKVFEYSHF